MAACTTGFPAEQLKPTLCRIAQGILISANVVLVHRAVSRQHRPLETGHRSTDILNRDLPPEDLLKELAIARHLLHLGHHFVMVGKPVLNGVCKRPDGLIFQRRRSTIPKLCFAVDSIE